MRHPDLLYILALQKVEGIGDVLARKLISHFGSAEAVFKGRPRDVAAIEGIGTFRQQKLKDKSALEKAKRELDFIDKHGIGAHYFDDTTYPEKLRHCPDAPLVLFSRGHVDLSGKKIVSIVGTRQATPYGLDACRKLVADLAPLDVVIVSGFAYGIDIAAHLAAIENGLRTIGVVGSGIDRIYPASHKKHLNALLENGGLMTEFWSGAEPEPQNFVRRNRIVAGMADATVVVESAEKGGSLLTANFANDYNREVFAVPGRVGDRYSEGCHSIIKSQKARLLTSGADVVYWLGWDVQTKAKPVQKQFFVDLSLDEQVVYDYLSANGKMLLDEIAIGCSITVSALSARLLTMELKGVVRPLPGKFFEAV
jgi:DNA processing protein